MKNMMRFSSFGRRMANVVPILALVLFSCESRAADGVGSKSEPFTGNAVPAVMDGGSSTTAAYYLVGSNRDVDAAGLDVGAANPNNNLTITNGAKVTGKASRIGFSRSSNGNAVTISGIGSAWRSQFGLTVGNFGSYNLLMLINGGAVSFGDVAIGSEDFSNGNRVSVTGYGTTFESSSNIGVGLAGSGNSFTVAGSARANCDIAVIGGEGSSSGNGVTVAESGSAWRITGANVPTGGAACLYVGKAGSKNILQVMDGANVDAVNGLCIGYGADGNPEYGSQNAAIVSGSGSVLSAGSSVYIGYYGSANLLIVQNGGLVKIDGTLYIDAKPNSSNNFIYIAGGFLALKGDITSEVSKLVGAGMVKLWRVSDDGSGYWETAVQGDLMTRYCAEAGPAKFATSSVQFAGYDNLGGYTIITGGTSVDGSDASRAESATPDSGSTAATTTTSEYYSATSYPVNYQVTYQYGYYPYDYWNSSSWYWYFYVPDPFFTGWMWPYYHNGYYSSRHGWRDDRWDHRDNQWDHRDNRNFDRTPDRGRDRGVTPRAQPQFRDKGPEMKPQQPRKDKGATDAKPQAQAKPKSQPKSDGSSQSQDQQPKQDDDKKPGPGGRH